MATNRMWLVNKVTGEKLYFATYYTETGWHIYVTDKQICDMFSRHAYRHLSDEERKTVDKTSKRGPPFARGSELGDEWELQYDRRSS